MGPTPADLMRSGSIAALLVSLTALWLAVDNWFDGCDEEDVRADRWRKLDCWLQAMTICLALAASLFALYTALAAHGVVPMWHV